VVHRDIKPGNIMLTSAGVKVLDFGLAKSPEDMTLTQANVVMGTPAYMAPEQREGRRCDTRTDIYALGLTLYEMATGKRSSTEDPASFDRLPEKLGHVIERCLALQPEDRWQSVSDVRNELLWAAKMRALSPPSVAAAASGQSPSRRNWWPIATVLAIAALAAGGWALGRFRPAPPMTPVLRYQIVPPQNGQLALGTNPSAGGIAISPDAATLAMVATVDGKTSVWLSPLDGSPARQLAGTENPDFPFWSPDSKSLGFFSGGALRKVDLATGAVIEICRTPGFGVGGAWLDDGTILFGELASGLMRVPASGGSPTLFTHLNTKEGERDHLAPQALPGGRFMYLAQHQARENNTVETAKLEAPDKRTRLVSSGFSALYAAGYLLFQRGSTLMAQAFDPAASRLSGEPAPLAETFTGLIPVVNASVSANGILVYDTAGPKSQLMWTDRHGQRLHSIGEAGNYGPARVSFDGHSVVTQKLEPGGGADLWIINADTGLPRRLTSDARLDSTPIWSPEGRTVVFSDTRDLFRVSVTGAGGEAPLLSGTNLRIDTDWSRDGSTIFYYERFSATKSDLGTLSVTADGKLKEGAQPRPYLSTQADETLPRFSPEPNPRWAAYQSDESGKFEVYIDTFPERSAVVRVSTGGGTYPQWGPISGDRSELFYVSGSSKLMASDLRLVQGRVEASPPHELFPLAPAEAQAGSSPFDTAPDGQRFLVRTPADTVRALTVVANWPTLVK
jgi:Tol biopolymer transport system component